MASTQHLRLPPDLVEEAKRNAAALREATDTLVTPIGAFEALLKEIGFGLEHFMVLGVRESISDQVLLITRRPETVADWESDPPILTQRELGYAKSPRWGLYLRTSTGILWRRKITPLSVETELSHSDTRLVDASREDRLRAIAAFPAFLQGLNAKALETIEAIRTAGEAT